MKTAAILLAAGQSRRMGKPKMLLPWHGRPLIVAQAETFLEAGVDDVVIVTGAYRQSLDEALAALPVRRVFNPRFTLDMATSIRAGTAALDEETALFFIMPADHPRLTVATVRALLAAAAGDAAHSVFEPVDGGRRGHPVGVRGSLRGEILGAPPEWTLRDLIRRDPDRCRRVPVNDPGIWQDADTPAEFTALADS